MKPTRPQLVHMRRLVLVVATALCGCTPGKNDGRGDGGGLDGTDEGEGEGEGEGDFSDDVPPVLACNPNRVTVTPPDGAIDVSTTFDAIAVLRMEDKYDESPELHFNTRLAGGLPGDGQDYFDPSIDEEVDGDTKVVTYTWSPIVLAGETEYLAGLVCGGRYPNDWFGMSWTFHTAAAPPDTGAPE